MCRNAAGATKAGIVENPLDGVEGSGVDDVEVDGDDATVVDGVGEDEGFDTLCTSSLLDAAFATISRSTDNGSGGGGMRTFWSWKVSVREQTSSVPSSASTN